MVFKCHPIFNSISNYRREEDENMKYNNLKFNTIICFALVLFSAFYLIQSLQYDYWYGYGPGAGFVPSWCSGLMLILSIICLFQSFKTGGINMSEFFPKGAGRVNMITAWAGLIFFAMFSKILGLIITSTIMLTVLFGRSIKWNRALIYGFAVSLCCFVLFKIILKVPVPVNKLGW